MPNRARAKEEQNIPFHYQENLNSVKSKMVKDVLDVGCGYGRASFFLYEDNYHVTGVDIDKVKIKSASKEMRA